MKLSFSCIIIALAFGALAVPAVAGGDSTCCPIEDGTYSRSGDGTFPEWTTGCNPSSATISEAHSVTIEIWDDAIQKDCTCGYTELGHFNTTINIPVPAGSRVTVTASGYSWSMNASHKLTAGGDTCYGGYSTPPDISVTKGIMKAELCIC